MFLIPVTLLTVIFNAVPIFGAPLLGNSTLVPLATLWGFAILGAIDDWEGVRGPRRGLGMRSRTKLLIQVAMAMGIAYVLREVLDVPQLIWPTSPIAFDFGWFYLLIASFIIVAMANAVNFTDGIDGLAGLISLTAFAVYGVVALTQGQVYLARFLLRFGRRAGWLPMVQCQAGCTDHGRYRLPSPGSLTGSCSTHDWPMAFPPAHRHHTNGRNAFGSYSGLLLQKLPEESVFSKKRPSITISKCWVGQKTMW